MAQLRQLNRTAPRPKARKPPSKPRSSPNLAGLGKTRSGGLLTKVICQMHADRSVLPSMGERETSLVHAPRTQLNNEGLFRSNLG